MILWWVTTAGCDWLVTVLSNRVPDLLGLQLLLAVESAGSLAAAGASLGISQQAASARLRVIETQVGAPLVIRGRRGSRLTPAGQLMAQWAEAVVRAAEELDAGIAALRGHRAAHVSVAASLTIAEHLVPRWLVALQSRRLAEGLEAVEVRLTAGNSDAVADAVRTGQADVGFVEGPRAPPGLRSRTVARDRLLLVVAPTHPWARRRRPVTPGEIAAMSLVSRERGSGSRSLLEQALLRLLPPGTPLAPPALEMSSAAAVKAAVVAGVAPGALSSLAVAAEVTAGRLTTVDIGGLDLRRNLRAVWAAGSEPPSGPARDLVVLAARDRG
jgi:DNA-binding transcriptional LysR family regulator